MEHLGFSLHSKMILFLNACTEKKNRHWQAPNVLNMEFQLPVPLPTLLGAVARKAVLTGRTERFLGSSFLPHFYLATDPSTFLTTRYKDNLFLQVRISLGHRDPLEVMACSSSPEQTKKAIFQRTHPGLFGLGYNRLPKLIICSSKLASLCCNNPSKLRCHYLFVLPLE